ncbi:MAG: Rrf2 family transcriptional regulator [Candidatus Omnitrophica bacterium]|nr:Rrf2 family transcriptional regulator [Candidatus Omnitrophota bacterium]
MKLLTKNSDYAIRAIVYLARHSGCFVSSREIAKSESIPLLFLRRILQVLIRERIVLSREGVYGGVKLDRPVARLSVADIIRIVQGDIQLSECMFRKRICLNHSHCALRKRINNIKKKVIHEFENLTIKSLLRKN